MALYTTDNGLHVKRIKDSAFMRCSARVTAEPTGGSVSISTQSLSLSHLYFCSISHLS